MASISAPTYLVRRNNSTAFYFRSVIPIDLRPILGTKEFWISLSTGLLSEAKKLSYRCNAIAKTIYGRIRQAGSVDKEMKEKDLSFDIIKSGYFF